VYCCVISHHKHKINTRFAKCIYINVDDDDDDDDDDNNNNSEHNNESYCWKIREPEIDVCLYI
jgi:hypothetical protein